MVAELELDFLMIGNIFVPYDDACFFLANRIPIHFLFCLVTVTACPRICPFVAEYVPLSQNMSLCHLCSLLGASRLALHGLFTAACLG